MATSIRQYGFAAFFGHMHSSDLRRYGLEAYMCKPCTVLCLGVVQLVDDDMWTGCAHWTWNCSAFAICMDLSVVRSLDRLLWAVWRHRAQHKATQDAAQNDVEVVGGSKSKPPRPPRCSGPAWRHCCTGFGSYMGWSSLFWLSFLGFFLALQAAWLASDRNRFPPLGQLYTVPIDGSNCKWTMLAPITDAVA